MARNSDDCRSNCPINFVVETVGDKWTLLVIRDLMFKGKRTFGEFLSSDEGISTNILAERLKRLEQHEIISKTVSPDNKSSLIYSLTDRGRDLLPVMMEITAWSARHDEHSNAPKGFLDLYSQDRDKLAAILKSQMK